MSFLLFLDESGQDRKQMPYEVLAGIAIQDISLWPLIQEIKSIEKKYFGDFYKNNNVELKAKKLLKRKTFRLASQMPQIDDDHLYALAEYCLKNGPGAKLKHLTSLAQSKIKYVEEVFNICIKYQCKIFASMIDYKAIETQPRLVDFSALDFLRKDYSFLFERYFYFLEDNSRKEMGVVVFDELEKSKSHILIDQMSRYFLETKKGIERSALIIPEPLFVHSDLTTGIHIADLLAYCIAWGFRVQQLIQPKRNEFDPYIDQICKMRNLSKRLIPDIKNELSEIWSIAIINS
jgi:hypothetical protein